MNITPEEFQDEMQDYKDHLEDFQQQIVVLEREIQTIIHQEEKQKVRDSIQEIGE